LSLAVVKLLGPGEYILAKPGKFIGHFGLATPLYTHFTAPNRRYPDLLLQRLVKAALLDEPPPYDAGELDFWATHCTEREDAARKVERRVRKIAAGSFLAHYIGETFRAIVTFRGRKGVFVRVLSDPANGVEGRIIAGEAGLDVGDTVTVRLVDTDPVRGFIDFTRIFV
jgi:exoribonuclease-2